MWKQPRKLAIVFGLVNTLLWGWLIWFTSLFAVKNSLEAGVGTFFVGMIFMGPGLLVYFPVAGIISLLYGAGLRVSENAAVALMAICGIIGWTALGYGFGNLLARRKA